MLIRNRWLNYSIPVVILAFVFVAMWVLTNHEPEITVSITDSEILPEEQLRRNITAYLAREMSAFDGDTQSMELLRNILNLLDKTDRGLR